jgi:hypothetical protein
MGFDCLVKEGQHRAVLQAQDLHHRQDALHKPAPRRAVATKGTTTPQHRAALHAFGPSKNDTMAVTASSSTGKAKKFVHSLGKLAGFASKTTFGC